MIAQYSPDTVIPRVAIIMGSDSDLGRMIEVAKVLTTRCAVRADHRSAHRTHACVQLRPSCWDRGIECIIAGAVVLPIYLGWSLL